jgi:hypothetical protein
LARSRQRQTQRSGQRRTNGRQRTRPLDNEGLIPILARAVREIESAVERGQATSVRSRFQAVALLAREERARVRTDTTLTEAKRDGELKRLDGIATILAQTAAREPSLFTLLSDTAKVSDQASEMRRAMLERAGLEVEEEEPEEDDGFPLVVERRVVPQSVLSRQLSNPFLAPDFTAVSQGRGQARRLAGWELLGPLFRSFEEVGNGAATSMPLPEAREVMLPGALQLMKHQAEVVAAAADGHRTFLLADEPGLGKTAQALLGAEAADAFPLLAVVPNVVKMNWAREAGIWVPHRTATVIHGDGHDINGFADIIVVNYEVLDRHVGWLGDFGFRAMVVDEAHFIKNKTSQRSQNVLTVADRIRARTGRPLLFALTGTPLINDIEDFQAIWEYLGWVDDKKPLGTLMDALEATGLTPADPGFYPAARKCVVDQGIVRRRKVDVAKDIPARRIADIPVELDDDLGRSIREAEAELARRLVARYESALATRRTDAQGNDRFDEDGIDQELARRVATWEREDSDEESTGENVFGMMRRIGQAKAGLAADYAAQLARNVGKVVFFAKHIDVMDAAQGTFERRGLRYSTIRGDQTRTARERNIKDFIEDPDVAVIVCSLTAAGVGINLQVASNLVLAELSWTDAEQTQAIDRVHRIGQDEPVTAWRIIAAQTIDTKVAELIDSKAGLAARALDGLDIEASSVDVQVEALVALLVDALKARRQH